MNVSNMNVSGLRKQGYKVRVKHYRPIAKVKSNYKFINYSRKTKTNPRMEVFQKGGYTEVDLTLPNNGKTYSAKAECSEKDAFNYRKGVQIALGRIMKQVEEDRVFI